jgi:hypothetical protein
MLDTYYTSRSAHVDADIEVHEHRAPTDQSIKLLTDMESAARSKLLSVNRLVDNTLDATWHVFDDPAAFDLKALLQFKLNGREFKIEVELERRLTKLEQARKVADKLVNIIAQHLAKQLFDVPHMQSLLLR